MQQIWVRRGEITDAQLGTVERAPLDDGQIRVAIEQFAVTANNVTYAAFGEAMRYWDFFPAPDGFGIVPVWGHARVEESRVAGIEPGERLYGYWPMASSTVLTPTGVRPDGFSDAAPHRAHLAAVYNRYRRLSADPGHRAGGEDVRAVFEPLFLTGWLIHAMFAREDWHGADTLVVTSASSKTALALAHVARAQSPHVKRIGLTSPGNIAFVEATGLYDQVLAYDAVAALEGKQAVLVDFAGNGERLFAIHAALGDGLRFSSRVGATDWRGGTASAPLPGPRPQFFFAPDHIAAVIAERGGAGFAQASGESWAAFAADAAALLPIAPVEGLAAAAQAYAETARGEARADAAIVVRLPA